METVDIVWNNPRLKERISELDAVRGLAILRVLPASLRKAAGIKISLGPGGGGQRFGLFQAG